jgi:sulfur carrier protein
MKVVLRNPRREVELTGPRRVKDVLRELGVLPETVLVIRGDELVTADAVLDDADTIELRPVMSGGLQFEPRGVGESFANPPRGEARVTP